MTMSGMTIQWSILARHTVDAVGQTVTAGHFNIRARSAANAVRLRIAARHIHIPPRCTLDAISASTTTAHNHVLACGTIATNGWMRATLGCAESAGIT